MKSPYLSSPTCPTHSARRPMRAAAMRKLRCRQPPTKIRGDPRPPADASELLRLERLGARDGRRGEEHVHAHVARATTSRGPA